MSEKPTYEELERRVKELEQVIAEAAFKNRESDILKTPGGISPHLGFNPQALDLAGIVDVKAIQSLMDDFYSLTNVGVAILDLNGKILVATGWQDICTKFHRIHPETEKNCIESDLKLSNGIEQGDFRLYQCKNHMWDMATPIVVGGQKVGNLYLGQFLFDDDSPDVEIFRRQARKHGFDEHDYIAALDCVPRWSRQTVTMIMGFYTKLAHFISELGHTNFNLKQSMMEKNALLNSLVESEEKYRILIENAQEAIFVAQDGIIKFANPKTEEISGYVMKDLTSRPFTEFIRPDDREMVLARHKRRMQDASVPSRYSFKVVHSSGNIRWVELNSAVIQWGDKPATLNFLSDITERRQAEEAVRDSEERFRAAFMGSPNAIVISTQEDGVWIDVNPVALEMFGYNREEVIGKSALATNLWAELSDRQRLIATLGQSGEVKNQEVQLRRKDGSLIIASVSLRALTLKGVKHLIFVTEDITERKRGEEALKNERDLIEQIMETSPAGITRVDANGVVVYANKLAKKFLGIELLGGRGRTYNDPVWKITDIEGEPFPEEKLPFSIVKQTGKPVFNVQHAIEWPDGKRVLLSINAAPLISAENQFDGMVAAIEDITQKYKAEQNYQMLFREMIDGFALHEIICDRQGRPIDYRFLAVNPAFERLTGFKREIIIGKTVLEVMPKTESCWIEKYGHVALTGKPIFFEDYSQEFDRYFQVTAFSPAAKQFACIFVDITDRKKSEEALRASHKRFLMVLDSIDATIYVADISTYEILFMNKFMINSFGRDMTGEICWDVFRGESGPCPHCTNYQLIDENGKSAGVKVWQGRNPITGKWYINYDRVIEWTDGRLVRLQIATDITEFKIMEEKLQQAQRMESIGNLAGGIAHDFNNILSSIIGFTELALDDAGKGTPLEGNLQEVYTAGKRARDLVKQILAFARQTDEERKPIHVDTIAKEVMKLIRSTIPKTIEIKEKIESRSLIMGNPSQVHQLLMNLCTNAAQVMEDAGGILEVGLTDVELNGQSALPVSELKSGSYVKVTVFDTGPGISPDIIGSIFDPYFTTKGVGEGTGMGLALVHGIVETCGGKITVESELGKGTVFSIYLPITKKSEDYRPYEEEKLPSGTERILFVDDELPIAKMGSQILERLGYQVTVRTSSVEALELFRSKPNHFDLVITDMTMPNMTGDLLAIELMRIRSGIPVLLCTGYSKKLSDETASEIGIKAFAYKPVAKADLAKMVRKMLDDQQQEQTTGRILLIDDDPKIRKLFIQKLAGRGYEIIEACDGKEGLRLYHENRPDLVITDLVMPEKEGIEMIAELKREFPDVKIIAISGGGRNVQDAYLHIAKSLGAERTFTKPIDWPELIKAVRGLLK